MKHQRFSIRIDSKTLADVTRLSKRLGYSRNATIMFLMREGLKRIDRIIHEWFDKKDDRP